MTKRSSTVVEELDRAVATRDDTFCLRTLRKVTDLFVGQSVHLGEQQVTVFDTVIGRLADRVDEPAKADLSERLALIPNAPKGVIQSLARGSIEVARPILEHSPRLDEADLLAVAEASGSAHLLAISRRPVVPASVTDVLVKRGDETVTASLATNSGAQFSAWGMGELIERSRGDDKLQSALEKRIDLDTTHISTLYEIARARVCDRLREEFSVIDNRTVDQILEDIVASLSNDGGQPLVLDRYNASLGYIRGRARAGELTEANIIAWLKGKKLEDVLAGLSHLAGLPLAILVRAHQATAYEPLLFILRSIGFEWATFKTILTQAPNRNLDAELLKAMFTQYESLSPATAQKAMRFVASKAAIDTVKSSTPLTRPQPDRSAARMRAQRTL